MSVRKSPAQRFWDPTGARDPTAADLAQGAGRNGLAGKKKGDARDLP